MRCIRLEDIPDRSSRREMDKLAPIRTICEKFVRQCTHAYILGEIVTVCKTLEYFRDKCCFSQYIPSKSA